MRSDQDDPADLTKPAMKNACANIQPTTDQLDTSQTGIKSRKSGSFRTSFSSNSNLIERIEKKLNTLLTSILSDSLTNPNDLLFILIDDSDILLQILTSNEIVDEYTLITSSYETRILFDTILKWYHTNQPVIKSNLLISNLISHVKLIVIGNDQYLNKYAQVYVDLLKSDTNVAQFFKHYFVPRNTSILATYMCKLSASYNALFGDEFWSKLDSEIKNLAFRDVWSRLIKYIGGSSSKEYSILPLQIGKTLAPTYNLFFHFISSFLGQNKCES